MREKLIELLKHDPCPSPYPLVCPIECKYSSESGESCFAERYADYLIANDVTVREKGEWEHGYRCGQYGIWCNKCGAGFAYSESYEVLAAQHNYCPNCGADMRGVEHESD